MNADASSEDVSLELLTSCITSRSQPEYHVIFSRELLAASLPLYWTLAYKVYMRSSAGLSHTFHSGGLCLHETVSALRQLSYFRCHAGRQQWECRQHGRAARGVRGGSQGGLACLLQGHLRGAAPPRHLLPSCPACFLCAAFICLNMGGLMTYMHIFVSGCRTLA